MKLNDKKTVQTLIAGFGGQGVLFAGKFLAYAALYEDKEISWLPSYGPEMRGGTANCSVIIGDSPIGSPIVSDPDILIVMNLPSLDKYESKVVKDGIIVLDSSLISRKCERDDVSAFYVPATQMASDNGLQGLANMIMIGKVLAETSLVSYDNVASVMEKVVPAKKRDLLGSNLEAIKMGYEFGK